MSTADLPKVLPYQPVRMSVARYHALIEAGAFTENDRVELLDGVVTEKMSKNPAHSLANRRCDLALLNLIPEGWHVLNQEPVTLINSEPEPDVAVVRGKLEDFSNRHPLAKDVALVVEIADSTLVTDRYKLQLYSEADIPVYWIVNLRERCVETYASPDSLASPPQYLVTKIFRMNEAVPLVIDGVSIGNLLVNDLLP